MFTTPLLLKALPIGGFVNARILKDHAKRVAFAANEERRQALRYLVTPIPSTVSNALTADLFPEIPNSHSYNGSRPNSN